MSTIRSALTLQLALAPFFKERGLPALTVSLHSNAVYLQGPCGQTICKVFYTGTNKLTIDDYQIIYNQVVSFIDTNINTLNKLFALKQAVKDAQELKINCNFNYNGSVIDQSSVCFYGQHPLYNKHISGVYADGKFYLSGTAFSSYEDMIDTCKSIKKPLKAQQDYLAKLLAAKQLETDINDIITSLSACGM